MRSIEPVYKQYFRVPLGKTSGCKLVPPVAGNTPTQGVLERSQVGTGSLRKDAH